jgi:hypothetical protein
VSKEPRWFAKKPCKSCPFRQDVRPFLHPKRAEEIAYSAQNKYNSFHCHATLGHDDEEGDTMVISSSLLCAGFLAMQINETGTRKPFGFNLPTNCYSEPSEMVYAYEDQWERDHKI